MNHRKSLETGILIVFLFLLTGCGLQKKEAIIPLNGTWFWTTTVTDEDSFTLVQSKKELFNLTKKLPDQQGEVFLVTDFVIPEDFAYSDVSFYLGRARLADRVYLNGSYIGGSGSFPPNLFTAGYGARYYHINDNLLNYTGVNRLIVELYIDNTGGLYSDSFIGPTSYIRQMSEHENFYHSRINEIFSFFMILISIFYFFQFLARPEAKENLYYSLINFFTAFFLVPFFVSEIPSINGEFISMLSFSRTFEMSAALVTAFFATSYILAFIHEPATSTIIITRLALLLVPIAVLYTIPDYFTYNRALPIFFLFLVIQILFAIWFVIRGILVRNLEVKPLLSGFYPVIATIFVDFFIHVIGQDSSLPIFTIYGWQVTIISNLAILSFRLNTLHKQIEDLNATLEKEVQDRTRDLIKANQALEVQIQHNRDDIQYATSVQRNFFPNQIPVFTEWEIGYHLQPVSGVSGDFFDFFASHGKLNGISLFDVSGHGLAAGLVTMLCKSIIEDKFNMTSPLELVLMNMHYGIVAQKGEIENYLVGTVVRLHEDGQAEMTGAGNQPPILIHTAIHETEALTPPENAAQYGMIGVSGLDVCFATRQFKMICGDVLVLFTDGVTEALDPHGIEFGREMVESVASQTIYDSPESSAQDIADAVIRALKRFAHSDTFEDDVTLLVLKKK